MRNQVAVAVGLIAGLLLGVVADLSGSALLLRVAEELAPIGTAFISLIRMVVVPLVATTLFTGVAAIANPGGLGKLGGITLFCFWSASLVAIGLGMAVMKLALVIVPAGSLESPPAGEELQELPGAVDFLLGLIPSNPFQAAADGALLPLVVFMAFFGAAASTLPDPQKERLTSGCRTAKWATVKSVT